MRLYLITIPILLLSYIASAQIPYVDSRETIMKGISLYDSAQYKKAIEAYKEVHECDTNYALAQYEMAMAYQADTAWLLAKAVIEEGLKARNPARRDLLLLLAANYDYRNKRDSSVWLYDSIIRRYPNDNQAWYEKGIVLFKEGRYDDALTCVQQSLMINPGHFRSHYISATIYALQGRLTEAMIAAQMSLLMTQNTTLARQAIVVMNGIAEGTDETVNYYKKRDKKYRNAVFDEIDELLYSKVALSKKYKLKIDLNENIFRQLQLVMEKLRFDSKDSNFVMQYYVPLLTGLYDTEMFEGYMLALFSGFDYQNVNDLAKKRSADVAKAKKIATTYLTKIQATRQINYEKRTTANENYHYFPADNLIAIGTTNKDGGEVTYTGEVSFYNNSHTLLANGYHNKKGEREGWWTTYFHNGLPKSRGYYRNGEAADTMYYYHRNGTIDKIHKLDIRGNVVEEYEYYQAGWLNSVRRKVGDDRVEEKNFYANGRLQLVVTYEKSQIADGTYATFYPNGKLKQTATLQKGKSHGNFKSYYVNGAVNENVNYDKGELNGLYESYYPSGSLKEKSTFVNGKMNGAYEEYYEGGGLSEKGQVRKGVKTETYEYTRTGRQYAQYKCKSNGLPVSITFWDESGKEIYKKEDVNGLTEYDIFYPDGNLRAHMKLNEDGNKNGLVTVYYRSGAKSVEANYKDGVTHGWYTAWHTNGKKMNETEYTDGVRNSYMTAWYANGNKQHEGWYKGDVKQGLWRYYYQNGKLKTEIYYLNDNTDGWFKDYNVNGMLTDIYYYDKNINVGRTCFDNSGNRADSVRFSDKPVYVKHSHWLQPAHIVESEFYMKCFSANGKAVKRYITGAVCEELNYNNGMKDSTFTEFFPNGIVMKKGQYADGEKTGKWYIYNEMGELEQEMNYRSDELNGSYKVWSGGKLRATYNYKNDSKEGAQIYYGDDGKIALALIYEEGELTGYSHEGKDGKLLPGKKLKTGENHIVATYNNGAKSAELTIDSLLITGEMTTYYSNGQQCETRFYNNMGLNGTVRRYMPDGKLIYEATYINGELHGAEKYWDSNGTLLLSIACQYNERHGITEYRKDGNSPVSRWHYHYGRLTGAD